MVDFTRTLCHMATMCGRLIQKTQNTKLWTAISAYKWFGMIKGTILKMYCVYKFTTLTAFAQ